MIDSSNGGVLGAANVPSFSVASGCWRASDIARRYNGLASGLRFPPNTQDASFSSVVVLLHFDDYFGLTNYAPGIGMPGFIYVGGPTNGACQSVTQTHFGAASAKIDAGASNVTSQVQTPTNTNLSMGTGDFTIEGWYYLTSLATQGQFFDMRTFGNSVCPLVGYNTDGSFYYFVSNANRITSSAGAVTTGNWFHVALARASSSTKMFMNGTQVGSTYSDSNNYTNGGIAIGNDNTQASISNLAMRGYVSEFRITKGVCRYPSNFTAPTTRFPDF